MRTQLLVSMSRPPRRAGVVLMAVVLTSLSPHSGTAKTVAARYTLSASAALAGGTSVQSAGRFALKASLSAAEQAGTGLGSGRYTLSAAIQAQPLVCTGDTIFEDGFDG